MIADKVRAGDTLARSTLRTGDELQELGEANVTTLAAAARLSQSALSQHLAKLRAEGLVAFRREGQTLWYRIADPRVEELLATLHRLFCPAPANPA